MKPRSLADTNSVDSLLALIDTLRHAPEGADLTLEVERARHVRDEIRALIERAFLEFLVSAMQRFERRADIDAAMRLKAKVISRRAVAMIATPAAPLSLPDAAALEQHLIAMLWTGSQAKVQALHLLAHEKRHEPAAPAATNHAALQPLARALAHQLQQAEIHSGDSLARLKTVEAALEHAHTRREMDEARDILRDLVHELQQENKLIDDALRQARYHANQIAFKTGASMSEPDAAAFERATLLRRLEAEARRAERHKHPLSLILLDAEAGDAREAARQLIERVKTCARSYDVVLPYQTHGVAWLVPGAGPAEGMQAVRKLQKLATGRTQTALAFSGAVVCHLFGEKPEALLARAEALALRARNAGPGRIEADAQPKQ